MNQPIIRRSSRPPDFRNLGIWLRTLLAVNLLLLLLTLAANHDIAKLPLELVVNAALAEPVLLLLLGLLYFLAPKMRRMSMVPGVLLAVLLAAATTWLMQSLIAPILQSPFGWRAPLAAAVIAGFLVYWFGLSSQARAPALVEARVAALSARIRPHFLYNSLNAILGVIRENPRRAEEALEELSELFRALMRDNRDLILLAEEIDLARKYLDVERLRLGDRLHVDWRQSEFPSGTLTPPLLLQPLLENAVYHGVEPNMGVGEIRVSIRTVGREIRIHIDNPLTEKQGRGGGNHMALDNLRERLLLFFDLEASIRTASSAGRYHVSVRMPIREMR